MERAPPANPIEAERSGSGSLPGRLFNVSATPGDVFEEIKGVGPAISNSECLSSKVTSPETNLKCLVS